DLHPTVAAAALEAYPEAQLKVGVLLLAAQEGVELDALGVRRTGQDAVLVRPELVQAFPLLQAVADEGLLLVARAGGGDAGAQTEGAGQEESCKGEPHGVLQKGSSSRCRSRGVDVRQGVRVRDRRRRDAGLSRRGCGPFLLVQQF